MPDINISKAPKSIAVLPFYAVAALAFLVLTILLFLSINNLSGTYFQPHILAIVHTATLAWGTMIIFGASYQLLPVICEKDLYSPLLAIISFFLLFPGAILVVYSFWFFQLGWLMITGGLFVLGAAVLYSINVFKTAAICKKHSIAKLFITISSVWLVITVVIGCFLAINLFHPFISRNHLDILKLHAHIGLVGWFLLLITGITIKLIPMFLLGKSNKTIYLYNAFLFENTGLILFIICIFLNTIQLSVFIGGSLVLLGIVFHLLYLFDIFKNRIPRPIDIQMRYAAISFLFLIFSVFLSFALIFLNNPIWGILYGTLVFMGWITSLILGQTFKTLPFIVWNSRYKSLNGKQKIPYPKHLYYQPLIVFQYYIYIAAMIVLGTGICVNNHILKQIGLSLFILVALLYGFNVYRVLLYKPKLKK